MIQPAGTPKQRIGTAELLERAGFKNIQRCEYKQTAGPYPEIVQLDNRREESLFVEARK